ncbi:hypothetical protein Tco_1412971, partial [Tanacetum coccineum]
WNNPKGKEYPFNLSKPLLLIMERGRQVVPVNYFLNNDLDYLRGGSSSKKYTTSTTKTKVAKYDIPCIEDMVLSLHMHDIEDMLLLLVQKKLTNIERDVIFDLGVALQMFTKRIVILKRVKNLQLGVESYQKKFNITKPETFRTLTSIRTALHDITSNLRMDYLPKRRWSNLDRQRSRIMIKAIDKLLLEIRLMRSLEKFIGGRDYREDLRLLERTIWLCHILSYSISGGAFLKSKTIESYKVVRYRCSFLRFRQNRRDLPRDIPLVRIEVLRTSECDAIVIGLQQEVLQLPRKST